MVIMDMNFGHGIGLWSSYGLYFGLLSDWLPWSSYGRELSGLMYVSKKHQWKHKVIMSALAVVITWYLEERELIKKNQLRKKRNPQLFVSLFEPDLLSN